MQCESNRNAINNIKAKAEHDRQEFIVEKLEDGGTIAKQKRVLVSNQKTMNELVNKVEGLRKIKTQVRTIVKTEIREVKALPVTIPTLKSAGSSVMLKLPQSYGVENKYYSIYYTIDTSGSSIIDHASFMLYPTISIGYVDRGTIGNLIHKREPVVTFEPGSPYSTTIDMSNISIEEPKKRRGLQIGGYLAAFFIGKAL